MLHYFIQTHRVYEQYNWSFSLLYDTSNSYSISVDGEADELERAKAIAAGRGNIRVFRSVPVVWGGMTVVTSMLRGMRHALGTPGWTHFINLSGYDAPLWSQAAIRSYLQDKQKKGYDSFIGYYGDMPVQWDFQQEFAENQGEWSALRSFPYVVSRDDFREILETKDISPIMNWTRRPAVHVTENILLKGIFCRSLSDQERLTRAALFSDLIPRYRGGRQWFVFSREMCEWIASSDETIKLIDLLRDTLIPDEAFFQTLVEAAPAPLRKRVFSNNLRFSNGDPIQLTDDALPHVKASKALFARKLTWHASEKMRAFLQERQQSADAVPV